MRMASYIICSRVFRLESERYNALQLLYMHEIFILFTSFNLQLTINRYKHDSKKSKSI